MLAGHYGSADGYEPSLTHLDMVREALDRGDVSDTYRLMNEFMRMLEARVAGIPAWSANALFDACGTITPPMYHDVSRHVPRT